MCRKWKRKDRWVSSGERGDKNSTKGKLHNEKTSGKEQQCGGGCPPGPFCPGDLSALNDL